jgi:hypothetical protein
MLALFSVALLLTGCGSVTGKIGTAAIVGNIRIPDSSVKSWFDAVLRKDPVLADQLQGQGEMGALGRQIASLEVQQELLRQAALRYHLPVNAQSVDDVVARMGGPRAASEGQIYTPRNVADGVRAQLIVTELGRAYLNRLAITFDYTQAANRREARVKAERMAHDPQQAAALVAADSAEGVPAATNQPLRAADNPGIAAKTPIFGAPPGTVLAFRPNQSGRWLVVRILTRHAGPAGPASRVDLETVQEFGWQLLGMTENQVGVRLSPRYGVWDPIALAAVPNQEQTTGFRLFPPPRD